MVSSAIGLGASGIVRGSAHEGRAGIGAAPESWDYVARPLRWYLTGGDGGGLDTRLSFGPPAPLSESEGPFMGRRIGILRRDGRLRMFSVDHVTSFVPGTLLRTPDGPRRVDELRPGDRVMTLDNGPRAITWVGRRQVRGEGRLAPVLIRPGALGNRGPVILSPSQQLVLKDRAIRLLFGRDEALVAVRHLLDGDRIVRSPRPTTEFVLLQMDGYQVLDEGDFGLECAEPMVICEVDEALLDAPEAPCRAGRARTSHKMARGHRLGLTGVESRMLRAMMAAGEPLAGLGRPGTWTGMRTAHP